MNRFVIYHQVRPGVDCPDGIVAAWVATLVWPESKIVGRCYNDDRPWPDFPLGSELLLVDFSVPYSQLCRWEDDGHYTTLIDHHKTAMENFQDLNRLVQTHGVFDLNECGASLAWKHFYSSEPPAFLKWIRSRDLWLDCNLFEDPIPKTLLFHEWHGLNRKRLSLDGVDRSNLFAWYDNIQHLSDNEIFALIEADGIPEILQQKREPILKIANRAEMTRVAWVPGSRVTVPVVKLAPEEDRLCSDICMAIYTKICPDSPFVACQLSSGEISLRSQQGTGWDVEIIAKHNGGGGHRHAAGFCPPKGWDWV